MRSKNVFYTLASIATFANVFAQYYATSSNQNNISTKTNETSLEKCVRENNAINGHFQKSDGIRCVCENDGSTVCETKYDFCVRTQGNGNPTFTNTKNQQCKCDQSGQVICDDKYQDLKAKCLSDAKATENPFEENGFQCQCLDTGLKKCENAFERCVRVDGKGQTTFKNDRNESCECLQTGQAKCENTEIKPLEKCLSDAKATENPFEKNGFQCQCLDSGVKRCENAFERCVRVDGKGQTTFKNDKNESCECLQNGQVKCGNTDNTLIAKCLSDAKATENPFEKNGFQCQCLDSGVKRCENAFERCVRVDGKGQTTFKNDKNESCECLQNGQ
ncbi:hypothetical protein BB561_007021, partial [Smittium simulii]